MPMATLFKSLNRLFLITIKTLIIFLNSTLKMSKQVNMQHINSETKNFNHWGNMLKSLEGCSTNLMLVLKKSLNNLDLVDTCLIYQNRLGCFKKQELDSDKN